MKHTIEEINQARLVLSEMALEVNGLTGEPTREAKAAMVAENALGSYVVILRIGEQAADAMKGYMGNGEQPKFMDREARTL